MAFPSLKLAVVTTATALLARALPAQNRRSWGWSRVWWPSQRQPVESALASGWLATKVQTDSLAGWVSRVRQRPERSTRGSQGQRQPGQRLAARRRASRHIHTREQAERDRRSAPTWAARDWNNGARTDGPTGTCWARATAVRAEKAASTAIQNGAAHEKLLDGGGRGLQSCAWPAQPQ